MDGEYADRLGVRGVPTNVLVGADGIVRTVGGTTPAELHTAVRSLPARD
ncbi:MULTISPECIES: TlpA family protein disulfide reductase [unclassified Streptomyces]|nr:MULTISPECIES: hypothetical protein [unclassified Streptomyces]